MGKKRKLAQGARLNNQPPKRPHHPHGSTTPQQKRNATDNNKNNSSSSRSNNNDNNNNPPKQHAEPTIPFSPEDKILLVGDGDLSFAASLVEHHCCADVTATVLEKSREELLAKYPQAADNVARVEAEEGCRVLFGVDATKMAPFTTTTTTAASNKNNNGGGGGKGIPRSSERVGSMDRILFNFPHVGGKSTDVNRQVRANQELLVSFFRRALPSLAALGSIVVTLFEGEPYTLWNVRDLARHCGLRVERSFRFRADAYPGYRHARTLGVLRDRRTGEATAGAWRGEDRAARSYVFVKKEEAEEDGAEVQRSAGDGRGAAMKRSRRDEDDDSSSDE